MVLMRRVLIYGTSILLLTFFLTLYILGAARYITDIEENTCKMTYMFEYPQYVRIALDDDIEDKYPRFGLFAYGEGFVTENLRRMRFSGIPVLFIPGHAGSHKQVRSIASVSLRKSLKDRTPFHFDFFATYFGKDYNGLYGGVLMEETTYVSHCIHKILSLYKTKVDSVVLIGHSMGGMIAKGALVLNPNINASIASIIINLATPSMPTVVLDSTFANYYHEVQKRAKTIKDEGTSIVSIGGGPRDVIVTSTQIIDPLADINVLSTSIPDVWIANDHLSMLWCKELVISIVRGLFDCVDTTQKPPQIFSDRLKKIEALSYHFLHRTAGKKLHRHQPKIEFDTRGEWIENIQRQYVWDSKSIQKDKKSFVYLMIRLNGQPSHLTIEAYNLETKDWIFICPATKIQGQSRVCESGWNLSNYTRLTPDYLHRFRKTVDLNLNDLNYPRTTHIVVRIPPSDLDDHVFVNVDLYSRDGRSFRLKESVKNGAAGGMGLLDASKSDSITSPRGNIRYYVTLNGLRNAVKVDFPKIQCFDAKQGPHAVVELLEPWSPGISQVQFFTEADNGPKTLRLQNVYGHENVSANLRISLDPTCTHTFTVESGSTVDQLSCIIRDRWSILYMIFVSLLLIAVSLRLDCNDKTPVVVVTLILSLYFDVLLETCIAAIILCVFAIGTCCSVIFLGSVAHSIAVRFLARVIAFSTTWSDWLLGGLNQFPFVTTVFVMSLIPATCGALAMFISVFLSFLKLTRMYEDYLEELLISSIQNFDWARRLRRNRNDDDETSENTRQKIFNHLVLFMLWCFAAIPAVPSVLVWARNFGYETRLTTEDPVLLGSWTVLVFIGTLEIIRLCPSDSYRAQLLTNLLRLVGWVVLSTAAAPRPSFYQWSMPPIIAAAMSLLAINSLVPE